MLSASLNKTFPSFFPSSLIICVTHRRMFCANKQRTGHVLNKWLARLRNTHKERYIFYLTTHSTHFIYGYMASDIWTILLVRKETRCRYIGYSYRLTARVLLYAPSHRQDNTYHGLCYTSRGALAGTRNSSMGPPHEGSIRRPTAPWANALTFERNKQKCGHVVPTASRRLDSICTIHLRSAVCGNSFFLEKKQLPLTTACLGHQRRRLSGENVIEIAVYHITV